MRSPISGDGSLTLHPVLSITGARHAPPLVCTAFHLHTQSPLCCPALGAVTVFTSKNPHMQGSISVSNQPELICEASILGGSPPLITHQSLSPARWVPAPLLFPPHGN